MAEDIKETTGEATSQEVNNSTERFLTFLSDGLTFGVSTNYVIEIITNSMIRTLPMVPDYVKGIINLRGQIVPVVDIRLRMGKMEAEHTSTTCVVILNIDSISIGIVVDTVSQVLDIDKSKISPVPLENRQELVNGMISLSDKTVVLLLDCESLLQN